MKLLVDIGNTRIKWALLGSQLLHNGTATYKDQSLQSLFNQIWRDISEPVSIYLSNVGPQEINNVLTEWILQRWNCPVYCIKSSRQMLGVTNAYVDPEKLGVDRWLALIAAHNLYQGDVCIFDCGTAITVDVINSSGKHLGGLILPGLTLLQRSLTEHTENISSSPLIHFPDTLALLANNTNDAIARASLYAVTAFIKNLSIDLPKEAASNMTFLITGGDAPSLLPYLPPNYCYAPHLVLQGIAEVAKNNMLI